jgi:hypothetical protein
MDETTLELVISRMKAEQKICNDVANTLREQIKLMTVRAECYEDFAKRLEYARLQFEERLRETP